MSLSRSLFFAWTFTLFRRESFGTIQAGGRLCPPFLLYLWSNYNQTWHDGTLGHNLSKAIKILLILVITRRYVWRHQVVFGILSVKIRVPLSFVQLSWNLAHGSILRRWFPIRAKKSYQIRFEWEKCHFDEKLKFLPKRSLTKVLPWQHPRLLLTENYFKWCPI